MGIVPWIARAALEAVCASTNEADAVPPDGGAVQRVRATKLIEFDADIAALLEAGNIAWRGRSRGRRGRPRLAPAGRWVRDLARRAADEVRLADAPANGTGVSPGREVWRALVADARADPIIEVCSFAAGCRRAVRAFALAGEGITDLRRLARLQLGWTRAVTEGVDLLAARAAAAALVPVPTLAPGAGASRLPSGGADELAPGGADALPRPLTWNEIRVAGTAAGGVVEDLIPIGTAAAAEGRVNDLIAGAHAGGRFVTGAVQVGVLRQAEAEDGIEP